MKNALITGISGQDGAYLAKLLLEKGYHVVGASRRSATSNVGRLAYLGIDREIEFYECELLELTNIVRMVERTKPDEIYNLAAQSFVGASFEQPIFTVEVNGLGALRLLEAVRLINPAIRFYQASTSEMFGNAGHSPQNEATPFSPRSPYGVAKLMAHNFVVNYRAAYGRFCASGILFNHESPLRGREFVTRRVTASLAEIKHGRREPLVLGNLDARRDWGYAPDYVEGMWRMLQQDVADDYVLATGISTSVRRFIELAGEGLGFKIEWSGVESDTIGIDTKTGREIVATDQKRHRPADVFHLLGSPDKASGRLGWRHSCNVDQLAVMMAMEDDRRIKDGIASY